MSEFDLKKIANSGAYGSGKAARDMMAAQNEALALLPETHFMPEVVAASDCGTMVPMCHFGNSSEDGKDWGIYHDGMDYCGAATMGSDARTDAKIVAAIVNAYRMGLLVRRDALKGQDQ